MKTQAINIHSHGGPEVLLAEEVNIPAPVQDEIRVRVHAVGVNFIDVYHRTGLYPVQLPATLGLEGAGVVEAVGDEVQGLAVGDRVGYCTGALGAYAGCRLLKSNKAVRLPDDVSFEQAAAVLLKGMTAEYLIRRVRPTHVGDVVLFHAIAGGVGLIACQWLKQLGAVVIGTVGSEEKAELARAHGCDHVIFYGREDVAAAVRKLTDGAGVSVAYDSVGATTFEGTLNALSQRGMFVSFGNASGPVAPVAPALLAQKGSLFFTRPTLMNYCGMPEELRASADALFFALRTGVKINIGSTLPLSQAAKAHRALESRQTIGSTILLPD
ncbi:quinone oxidoreductase [Candidatus Persebacteraceae bacterium Df01]|uniref:Quinone oxidoreductase n=1 Tax=Candidatus Doriopsillibacter californiensis TaxID=2970740 RepID=A0ABT7QMY7_9GAMM|nr:quinone oxidoreductase [Candidatus Persebacteraceae bacterium Df01]